MEVIAGMGSPSRMHIVSLVALAASGVRAYVAPATTPHARQHASACAVPLPQLARGSALPARAPRRALPTMQEKDSLLGNLLSSALSALDTASDGVDTLTFARDYLAVMY